MRVPWIQLPAALIVLTGILSHVVARAADWPLVRGDGSGTGVAQGPVSSSLEVVWKYQVADRGFEATAVVVDEVVYVGDNDGTFHALNLVDGQVVWTKDFEQTGFLAAAAVAEGRIYAGDYNGVMHCMSTSDGQLHWSWEGESEFFAGPNLHEGTLLATSEAGTLSCLRLESPDELATEGGDRLKWQFRIDAPLRCSPTLVLGHALLAGCDSRLHVIDVASGDEVASLEIDSPTGSTAAAREARAFFGTESGTFFAIDIAAPPAEPTVAWTYADPKSRQGIRTAAAVSSQLVVYGSQGKTVYALDPGDGTLKWQRPFKSRVESSPVIAGDRVVVATTRGRIYLLDVTDGEIVWEYEAGGGFVAAPVVVDGQLLIGNTDGTLYCFGAAGKAK